MRVVLDTNVLVSALLKHGGPPEQLLELWEDGSFELVTSQAQTEELFRALAYDKLRRLVTRQEAEQLRRSIIDLAVFVKPTPGVSASADPDDNLILATAIAGRAPLLVSGDKKHLLPLGTVRGVRIVRPREAMDLIRAASGQPA
ncbi:MAG: putative toxin-antitoxin system toxin component, PIN family [Planctomycetota bacterium]